MVHVKRCLILAAAWGFISFRRFLLSAGQRLIHGKGSQRAATAGKHYRFIDPQQFSASNPAWLKNHVSQGAQEQVLPPPLLAFLEQVQNSDGRILPEFGTAARAQLFALSDVTYLNHGSYGAAFKLGLEVQAWYRDLLESEPVRFMEAVAVPGMLTALSCVAAFVGAEARDVVPVPNATTAVCTVLNCMRLAPGDVICMLNTTYPAVRSALARTARSSGARLLEVQLTLEHMDQPMQVVDALKEAIRAVPRGKLKLVVLDHVISFPPVILPVAQLAAICQQAGAQVLVDGAHAVGALPGLDVPALGSDYYTSNLHKWCCTPKGAAFLWVAPAHQHTLVPLVTSHGHGLGLQAEFLWQGTVDPSAWLAVPASLHVLQALGEHRVAEHNHRLVAAAAEELDIWRTSCQAATHSAASGMADLKPGVLGGDGAGGNAGMMAVALPPLRGFYPPSAPAAAQLHETLFTLHNIEVPVVFMSDQLWVRVSAQIYNMLSDYQRLIAALQPLACNQTG